MQDYKGLHILSQLGTTQKSHLGFWASQGVGAELRLSLDLTVALLLSLSTPASFSSLPQVSIPREILNKYPVS